MTSPPAAPTAFGTPETLPKVAYGKGVYVYDDAGKQYIDGSGGPSLFCIGHGHPEVGAAIKAQIDRIAHGYRYTFTSDPLEALEGLIVEEGGLERMVFVSGGSEAVESCLKVALQYHAANGEPSRRRFIARERSWHGNTLGALSVSGFQARRAPFEGALIEASFLSPVNLYRPPPGVAPDEVAAYCADELEREILRLGAERVAAFIFEPVVGAAGGAVPAPPGYAQRVRDICDRHGVLLIADEVMCGVGRCCAWRALAYDGVVPDIMALAKGLAGGYLPLGAAVYRQRIHQRIVGTHGEILTGHTFAGHTTACAAGLAVQRIIRRDGLVAKAKEDGDYVFARLRETIGDRDYVGDIRGRGLLIGVELVADRASKEPFDPELQLFARVRERALDNGLICYPMGGNVDGVRGDQVILSPPYTATRSELDEIIDKFGLSLKQVFDASPGKP
ncbi:MAG: aspartate aminotransferase family protein [Proteobacteria bacterium]|nr:aspartate aminotransferase family protein [Pseudomonadota bacterium]